MLMKYATLWLSTLPLSPCNLYVLFTSHFRLIYSGLSWRHRIFLLPRSRYFVQRMYVYVFFPVQQTTSGIGHSVEYLVVFFRLATNALNVRNNNNKNACMHVCMYVKYTFVCNTTPRHMPHFVGDGEIN